MLLRFLIGLAVLSLPGAASADVVWRFTKEQGRPYLQGMSSESESDTEFWARCRADGKIDVGLGADSIVGKGEGEKVSLTLESAGIKATLNGVSRNSVNVEMTGGTELRTTISRDDAVFKVLAADKPIAVSGAIKAAWPVKGLKAKVAAFLAACK